MIHRFAACELDTARHLLRRDGEVVHVEPQVFALLELLVSRAGEVVTRDEIIETVWNGRIVSEATVSARISAARAAVGDTGQAQAIIRTVTRIGLQLVAEIEGDAPPVHDPAPVRPWRPQVVDMTASKDGSLIAWAQSGEGPPLLRGGHWLTNLDRDLHSPIWGPYLDRLMQGRRLVRFDCRGTGMSDPDCGPLSLQTFTEDVEAVADAAKLPQFDIFASSQSLAMACHYAVRHPDRVRRIVSLGGWAQGSAMRPEAGSATMTRALGTMLGQGWGQPEGGFMKSFASLFIPGANAEQVAAFVDLQLASTTPERAVEMREVISRYDVTDLLPQVRQPVLVMHSRRDNLHPISQAQHLMRHLPDARLLVLDSANHILMPDEPAFEVMMDAVDDFLA